MDIELNIKKLLKEKEATLQELADYIKVSRPGMYGMLRNGTITLEKLQAIAQFFGLPISALINESNKSTTESNYKQLYIDTIVKRVEDLESLRDKLHKRVSELERENADLRQRLPKTA